MLDYLLPSVGIMSGRTNCRRAAAAKWAPESEALESRLLLSATVATSEIVMQPAYLEAYASPMATVGPTGTTPDQVRHAYGFDSVFFANGTIAGDGAGTTIAIVDAYHNPNTVSNLHEFSLAFGLPDAVLTIVNQAGGTTMPSANKGWGLEISLDVQWVHAIAPKAQILLVEAFDASINNLMAAVDYARRAPGVVAVSMSWGSREFNGEKSYDAYFNTPAGHGGVTFLASSGDTGSPVSYPAISPNVIGVGGTALTLGAGGTYGSETGWTGSGGGISVFESQPAYQKGIVTQTSAYRTSPDIAYNSDPKTGFPVYDSYYNPSSTPWSQVGGTSAAAPQLAAMVAIADQGRALIGLGALDGATQTLPKIYSLSTADFHDVTTGKSTGFPNYSAQPGYDLVTGRGTPIANLMIRDLIGTSTTTPPPAPAATHFSIAASAATTAGSTFSITVSALDSTNKVFTGYLGKMHFSSTDTAGLLPVDYTFTAADKGVHTFSGLILKTAGVRVITATDTVNAAFVGNVSITVSPAAGSRLAFAQQPTNVTLGAIINPAIRVQIFDAYNNLLSNDNLRSVAIALGNNPGAATLAGTKSIMVSGGVATFNSLSVNKLGIGYTLIATAAGLSSATSSVFNVVTANQTIESFEGGTLAKYSRVGGSTTSAGISTYVKHDGTYALQDPSGADWIYRSDSAAQVKQGDTVSVWMAFINGATGTAAFGFGASAAGTLSVVASPQSNQLRLATNAGYVATTIGTANQTWISNHWYRLEVSWSTTGSIVGKVYDTDGTTLLNSVSGSTTTVTAGGFGFQSNGGYVCWDTVAVAAGTSAPAVKPTVKKVTGRATERAAGINLSTPPAAPSFNQEAGASDSMVGGIAHAPLDDVFQSYPEIAKRLDSRMNHRDNRNHGITTLNNPEHLAIEHVAARLPTSRAR